MGLRWPLGRREDGPALRPAAGEGAVFPGRRTVPCPAGSCTRQVAEVPSGTADMNGAAMRQEAVS